MMIQISIRELLLSEGAGFVVHFHKRPSELVYNTSYYDSVYAPGQTFLLGQ